MKRWMVMTLVFVLTLNLVACQSGTNPSNTDKDLSSATTKVDSGTTKAAGDNGNLDAAIKKKFNNVTLSMFMQGIGELVTSYDYKDNVFTKKVTDETGINLKFIAVSDADASTKLSTLLNSNDYPDLIRQAYNTNNNDMDYYAKQGVYIPLDDYVDKYPNIAAAYKKYPNLKDFTKGSDGKVYALPEVNDCLHCIYSAGRMWYYMPFTRDNGKKVPQTTDELFEYLKFIRDNDVNGNGKKDEVPLAFHAGQLRNFISIFAKSFLPWVYSGQIYGLALDNGKIVEQYKSDKFKEALLYMKKLYDENLILKDSFSMKADQLRELGESPAGPTIAVSAVSWSSDACKKAGESKRWYQYFILPNVAGPGGSRYSGQQAPQSIFYLGMFVTNKCKNPEAAVALYDYFLNFEVMLDGYIGPKGECWADPDPDAKSLMGDQAKYKLLVTYGAQRVNAGWNQLNPMIRDSNFRLGEQANNFADVEKYISTGDKSLLDSMTKNGSFNEINNYLYTKNGSMPYPMPKNIFLPPLICKDADNTRITDIRTVLDPYLDQTFVAFITGKRNINTEWDAYLKELDKMGSAEMTSIMQKTYDSMKK